MADIPSDIEQLRRTVEMFEAIADAQPDDFQSLEILKEAYLKLGRREDLVRVGKRLAKAYRLQGEVSKAIFECEAVLQEFPKDTEATALLGTLLAGAPLATEPAAESTSPSPASSGKSIEGINLAQLRETATAGDRALSSVLIAEKIATPQAIEPLLEKLKILRNAPSDYTNPLSVLQLVTNEQIAKPDDLITALLEKSKLPYLPLSVYDVDRDAACLVPLDVCWQFCVVPFDRISRSTLVATSNPFDETARHIVSGMLNQNVFWYVSPPGEIVAAIRRIRGMDSGKQQKGSS